MLTMPMFGAMDALNWVLGEKSVIDATEKNVNDILRYIAMKNSN